MKVKKANYQHSLDRAAVLNPDEDIDVHDSKLSKSVLDLDKKIQRLEKKQKAIGDSLKAIQSEVRWSKGTCINDVPHFLGFSDPPSPPNPILSYFSSCPYFMTSFFDPLTPPLSILYICTLRKKAEKF